MANVTRYDPFGSLAQFDPFRGLEDLFGNLVFRPVLPSLRADSPLKIEVSEDDKAYRVKAEVPGVKKDDIKVSIDGNRVAISAETKREVEEKKGERVLHSERYYGKQYRAFMLEQNVDEEKAEARYSDGVLELSLPKKQGSSTKNVTIR
jgi:HSP20 family protein